MNEKARVFEQFLVDEKLTCFEKREVGDEDHTVVFRSYVQTELGDIPVFLLLDDTIYATKKTMIVCIWIVLIKVLILTLIHGCYMY